MSEDKIRCRYRLVVLLVAYLFTSGPYAQDAPVSSTLVPSDTGMNTAESQTDPVQVSLDDSTATDTLRSKRAAAPQNYISVLPISSDGLPPSLLQVLADDFRKSLAATGVFTVMEREDMSKIIEELEFQQTDLCEEASCLANMGKMIGVSRIIFTSISKTSDNTYAVSVKMVDVETAGILKTASEQREGDSYGINARMLSNLAGVLAGHPSQDHLDYLRARQRRLEESRQVERLSGKRFKLAVAWFGDYPVKLFQSDNDAPKRKYYENTPEITEWGLPRQNLENGFKGVFGYRLSPSFWLQGRAGYTAISDQEGYALGEFFNDTTLSVGSPPQLIRMSGPLTSKTTTKKYYNMWDLGLGLGYSLFRTPRIFLGLSLVPKAAYINYFEDSRDSAFTNNNYYFNGAFQGKGQIYSDFIYSTKLTGFAAGLDASLDVEYFLLDKLSMVSSIGLDMMYSLSLEGETRVEKYEYIRDPISETTLDTSYTQRAALMTGDFFSTGEFQQIKNPDVKEFDPAGRVVSYKKSKKEIANFRLSLGLAYYF